MHQDESCEEEELHPSCVLQRGFYSGDEAPSSSQLTPFFGIFLIPAHLTFLYFVEVSTFYCHTVPCRIPLALKLMVTVSIEHLFLVPLYLSDPESVQGCKSRQAPSLGVAISFASSLSQTPGKDADI